MLIPGYYSMSLYEEKNHFPSLKKFYPQLKILGAFKRCKCIQNKKKYVKFNYIIRLKVSVSGIEKAK